VNSVQLSWKYDFNDVFHNQQSRDDYFSSLPYTSVFSSWEWLSTSADHLAESNRQLQLFVAHRGSQLVALLPFSLGKEAIYGVPAKILRLLCDPLADQFPLPSRDIDALSLMLDSLASNCGDWDAVIFNEIPEGPAGDVHLQQWAGQSGARFHRSHCSRAPVLNLKGKSLETIQNSYSRSLRTRLKRSRKKLSNAGLLQVEHFLPEPHQTEELLKQVKAVEDSSWKGVEGVGIFSTQQRDSFFRDLAQRLAKKHFLDIRLMWLNGQLISYRFGYRFQNSYFDYNLAYLPEFKKLSPGRILLDEIINKSVADGLDSVDASHGGLEKANLLSDWPTSSRDHFQWWIFSNSLRGVLLHELICRAKPLARRILCKKSASEIQDRWK